MDGRPRSARRSRPWKRIGAAAAILFTVKLLWVMVAQTDAEPISNGVIDDDLMARRRYLVERHASDTYFDDVMLAPSEPFGSEWKLVSLSMTSAALTHIAFDEPDTQPEAVTVVARLARASSYAGIALDGRRLYSVGQIGAADHAPLRHSAFAAVRR